MSGAANMVEVNAAITRALRSPDSVTRRASLLESIRPMNVSQRREFFKSRTAELDAARDVELSALREKITAAQNEHLAAVSEAEAVLDAREAEIDQEIAEELKSKLYPLAKAFGDSGRATAQEFARVWGDLSTRLQHETGKEIDARHLALAFVAAIGDPNIGGCAKFWETFMTISDHEYRGGGLSTTLGGAAKACETNANAIAVEAALRKLEAVVATAMAAATHPSARMLDARQSFASRVRVNEAVERTRSTREFKIEVRNGRTPEDDARDNAESKKNEIRRMLDARTPQVRALGQKMAKEHGISLTTDDENNQQEAG